MRRKQPIDALLKTNNERVPEVGEEEGIAKRLKMAAEQANVTQVAIAKELGMQHPSVNAWFRGKTVPDVRRIRDLARILNVKVEWLITGSEDNTPDALVLIEKETDELLEERGNTKDTFTLAASLISTIFKPLRRNLEPYEFALIEIQHEISRIMKGSYHPDHWDAIEGYARLGKKLQERKELER